MAIKVESYKWFEYRGRDVVFNTASPDHSLHLSKGEVFAYKQFKGKHYLVDKSELNVRFSLKPQEADRVIRNSIGWSGKVAGMTVKAGSGGLDKPVSSQDTKVLHHLQIDSSNLKAAVYNKAEKILTVMFHNGAVWDYLNVSQKEANALEDADSQGRYFIYKIREVKDQHKSTWPVEGSAAPAPAPKTATSGKSPVKFKLTKAELDKWLGSEYGAYEDSNKSKASTYAIIERQRVDNEKELIKLMDALRTSSFEESNPRQHKSISKKILEIAKDYPFTASGKRSFESFKKTIKH